MSQETQYHFEKPIAFLKEDKLNRSAFAESLAKGLRDWRHDESYIIALYGEWGSGKTSIKNMMVDYIDQNFKEEILHTTFNPWQWSGQKLIALAFLNSICKVIGKKEKGGKRLAKLIKQYSILLNIANGLLSGVRGLLLWLIGIPTVILNLLPASLMQYLPIVTLKIVNLLFILAALIGFTSFGNTLFERISAWLVQRTEVDIDQFKHKISEKLKNFNRPILIIIDDIDRVHDEAEIRYLIQLIKHNLDFPNIVYLLLCQKDVIEKCLTSNAINGADFLEKIVHLPFDVPYPNQATIDQILFDKLEKIINKDESLKNQFNWPRWKKIYFGDLRIFFKNLRKVNRYIISLEFYIKLFKGEKAYNINPVDLCVIEVLRIFESGAYNLISRSKYILVGYTNTSDSIELSNRKACVKAILSATSKEHRASIEVILKFLFPKIKEAYSNYRIGIHQSAEYDKEMQICHTNWFDCYFSMSLAENVISRSEYIAAVELIEYEDQFINRMLNFKNRGLIVAFLDMLNKHKKDISHNNAVNFIKAMFDFSEELSISDHTLFLGCNIIWGYLKSIKDVEKRGEILLESLNKSVGIVLPLTLIEKHKNDNGFEESDVSTLLTRSHQELYKKIVLDRIQDFLEKLLKPAEPINIGRNLGYILVQWKELTDLSKVRAYVNQLINRPAGIDSLLRAFSSTYWQVYGDDYVEGTHPHVKEIKDYIPLDQLLVKLGAIDRQFSSVSETELIHLWTNAIEAFIKNGEVE